MGNPQDSIDKRTTLIRGPDEPLRQFFARIVSHVGWCVLTTLHDGEQVCGVLASASHGHLEICPDLRQQDQLVSVGLEEVERIDLMHPPYRWVVPWEMTGES